MEENQFKCSGDCLNCRKNPNDRMTQWQYCAAQFTYNSMRMIDAMKGTIDELKAKIEALQNNEATVYNPTGEASNIPLDVESNVERNVERNVESETTQEGAGV